MKTERVECPYCGKKSCILTKEETNVAYFSCQFCNEKHIRCNKKLRNGKRCLSVIADTDGIPAEETLMWCITCHTILKLDGERPDERK